MTDFVIVKSDTYVLNTTQSYADAKAAMRDARKKEVPIWRSPTQDPYHPDVIKTDLKLFAR